MIVTTASAFTPRPVKVWDEFLQREQVRVICPADLPDILRLVNVTEWKTGVRPDAILYTSAGRFYIGDVLQSYGSKKWR